MLYKPKFKFLIFHLTLFSQILGPNTRYLRTGSPDHLISILPVLSYRQGTTEAFQNQKR